MVERMPAPRLFADLFADLNSCCHLFLRELCEPPENSLKLVIEEGIASTETTPIEIAGIALGEGHRVTTGKHTRLFEVVWDSYVAYCVANESYTAPSDSEKFEFGNLARVYSDSNFLNYIRAATIACDEYPGPSQHVQIICERHIIDVASTAVPTVKIVRLGKLA